MLSVGDRIAVSGRVQSRQYEKKYSETDIRRKTAYEVSISKLATHDTDDVLDLNKEFKRYVG
ncbi:MAG: single-stranded DNA-binding protein, partial [Clostridia bacterium]|nr:single-stranded DNA-binding protein [Clostridia bacterium]